MIPTNRPPIASVTDSGRVDLIDPADGEHALTLDPTDALRLHDELGERIGDLRAAARRTAIQQAFALVSKLTCLPNFEAPRSVLQLRHGDVQVLATFEDLHAVSRLAQEYGAPTEVVHAGRNDILRAVLDGVLIIEADLPPDTTEPVPPVPVPPVPAVAP